MPAHHADGRKRLAQYILRAPFSLQKITWKPETQTGIYRSKPHHTTKRNFQMFKAADFIAALVDRIPPESKHTVRYYGVYSNKTRGQNSRIPDRIVPAPKPDRPTDPPAGTPPPAPVLIVPPPPLRTARSMRPLWRDLILQAWGADPALCPRCNTPMKTIGGVRRPELIEFFLRLWGLWQGVIDIPPPPKPPFDIDTFEPVAVSQIHNSKFKISKCRRTSGTKPPGSPTTGANPGPLPVRWISATVASWCPAATESGEPVPEKFSLLRRFSLDWEGQTVFSREVTSNEPHHPSVLPENPPCSP